MILENNQDFIDRFEHRLAVYTGAPYCVCVNSCTWAILLALIAGGVDRGRTIVLPARTYLSVPMTLLMWGYSVKFHDYAWTREYSIGDTGVWDSAVGFRQNMYVAGRIQCLSFGWRKRLAIGGGGAILLDNYEIYNKLLRMRHDGRSSRVPVVGDDWNLISMGLHCAMRPEDAARGIILLNSLGVNFGGGSEDYPDISGMPCFEKYLEE